MSTPDDPNIEDATLDADLAAWHWDDRRPKLSVLGPISLTARGRAPTRRTSRVLEGVTYLAVHRDGVTREELATDLGLNVMASRALVSAAHWWLGDNPRTGRAHLPPSTERADGLLWMEDVLLDADLFRRLRRRAMAEDEDGIADLSAALNLVTGIPFDQHNPGRYGWLAQTLLDYEYTHMIVDLAHLLIRHHLRTGQPALAAAATRVALLADSSRRLPPLDLVAAHAARVIMLRPSPSSTSN